MRVTVPRCNHYDFVTLKCRTAINALFLQFNLCLSVISHVNLHPYPFLLQAVTLLYFVSKCNVR
jgi:hypothetical protein